MNDSHRISHASAAEPQIQRNARELAQRFPAEHRLRMQQLYVQSFEAYRELEVRLGLRRDDLPSALATFVIGNYMVYAGVEVPDEQFAVVAEQFRRDPALLRNLGSQGAQQQRAAFEQSAMVGVFMAMAQMSQKHQPQPAAQRAHMRDSAQANLQQVLGVDPARLTVGAQGLTIH